MSSWLYQRFHMDHMHHLLRDFLLRKLQWMSLRKMSKNWQEGGKVKLVTPNTLKKAWMNLLRKWKYLLQTLSLFHCKHLLIELTQLIGRIKPPSLPPLQFPFPLVLLLLGPWGWWSSSKASAFRQSIIPKRAKI